MLEFDGVNNFIEDAILHPENIIVSVIALFATTLLVKKQSTPLWLILHDKVENQTDIEIARLQRENPSHKKTY